MVTPKSLPSVEQTIDIVRDDIKAIKDYSCLPDESQQQEVEGVIARRGALVISVEGENWEEGLGNMATGRCRLGYFVAAKEFYDGYLIKFTKPEGFFHRGTRTPLQSHRRIEHPLSKKGFTVPRHGGILTLDNGYVLLLSKTGIFAGRGGYRQANYFRKKWIHEGYRVNELEDRLQQTTTQLKEAESQNLRLMGSKDDLTHRAMRTADSAARAKDAYVELREDMLSLRSHLESVQKVKGHVDTVLRKKITNLETNMNDIMAHLRQERQFESLALQKSTVPDMRGVVSQDLIREWKEKGTLPETEEDEKMKEIEEFMKKQDEKLKALETEIKSKKKDEDNSPPPPSSDDEKEEDDDKEDSMQDDIDEIEETAGQEEPPQPKQTTPPKGAKEKASAIVQEAKTIVKKAVATPPKDEEQPKSEETDEEGGEEEDTDEQD